MVKKKSNNNAYFKFTINLIKKTANLKVKKISNIKNY